MNDKMKNTKIVILGGGLGGLSVAHNLINRGFKDITLYEKNENTGGLARSNRLTKYDTRPIERSWRIVGKGYYNMRQTLREIPTRNGTIENRLIDLVDVWFIINSACVKMNVSITTIFALIGHLKTLCWTDIVNVSKAYLYGLTACKERIDTHDDEYWEDFVGSLSSDIHMLLVESFGPVFGVDPHKVNASSALRALENVSVVNPGHNQVMDQPWDTGLFKPWERYLKEKGVVLLTNTTITKIDIKNDKITRIKYAIGENPIDEYEDKADVYFICLPVEQSHSLLKHSKLGPSLDNLKTNSSQLMAGLAIYFDERIYMEEIRTAVYVPHTPWRIIIEPCGAIWNQDVYKEYGVGDIWFVTIDCPECKGTLFKKSFKDCSVYETKKEVMHQIYSSGLDKFLKTSSGKKFSEVKVLEIRMWDTFEDDNNGKIFTSEPKFSSNRNTLRYRPRPDITNYIKNAYMATAYCRISRENYVMDAAFESSAISCNAFMDKVDKNKTIERVKVHSGYRNFALVLDPLRALDNVLLRNQLPHIGTLIHPFFLLLMYFYLIYISVRSII